MTSNNIKSPLRSTQKARRHAPGGAVSRKGLDGVVVGELDVDEEASVVVEPVDGHRHSPHQQRTATPLGRFLRVFFWCVEMGLGCEGKVGYGLNLFFPI